LGQVLAACQEAVLEQQQQLAGSACGSRAADAATARLDGFLKQTAAADAVLGSSAGPSNSEVHQLAAELLRTWAFNSTFEYVDGVISHGPTWALTAEKQQHGEELQLQRVGVGGIASAAASAAAGV
jgi:hypothetical protein